MSLSPDCKQMAYIHTDSVAKEMRLVVSNLKDQEKRVLVTVDIRKAWIRYPIWSPDGRMIEYSLVDQLLNKRHGESRVVAVDGSWDRKIKTGKLAATAGRSANWSPEGTKLAMTLWDKPMQELRVMDNFLPK